MRTRRRGPSLPMPYQGSIVGIIPTHSVGEENFAEQEALLVRSIPTSLTALPIPRGDRVETSAPPYFPGEEAYDGPGTVYFSGRTHADEDRITLTPPQAPPLHWRPEFARLYQPGPPENPSDSAGLEGWWDSLWGGVTSVGGTLWSGAGWIGTRLWEGAKWVGSGLAPIAPELIRAGGTVGTALIQKEEAEKIIRFQEQLRRDQQEEDRQTALEREQEMEDAGIRPPIGVRAASLPQIPWGTLALGGAIILGIMLIAPPRRGRR